MNLGLDPWTGNRYAFGAGNPIMRVEIDGHKLCGDDRCDLYALPSSGGEEKIVGPYSRLKQQVEEIARTHDTEQAGWCVIENSLTCYKRNPDDPNSSAQQNETAVCNWLGMEKCAKVKQATVVAWTEAARMKEEQGWKGSAQRNAYQHAIWVTSMRLYGLSEHEVLMFAVAHELDHQGTAKDPNPWGGAESNKEMHNNFVGLRIARSVTLGQVRLGQEQPHQEAILAAMNPASCGGICLALK